MRELDEHWMEKAIALAEHGRYSAHPNPRVGCVLIKENTVVGSGWHIKTGDLHAEARALKEAGAQAQGATCYVTLAPCDHQGRTAPCTQSLIDAGIVRVVVAHDDPNPKATGGLERLAAAGIEVTVGPGAQQARRLNRGFLKRIETGRPFVTAKVGMSADARTALSNGKSKWITGKAAREQIHHLRAQSGAVVTGIGTVLADDPLLTARFSDRQPPMQPLRVILDTKGRLTQDARLLSTPGAVLHCIGTNAQSLLPSTRAEVLHLSERNGGLDLKACWEALALREVNDILLECGPTLLGSALWQGLVDELVLYVAPSLLGDQALPLERLPLIEEMENKIQLEWTDVTLVGQDVRLTAKVH